ncbi:MAG: DEAD/DEAH box helicase [Acidimicrobiales bacterium]
MAPTGSGKTLAFSLPLAARLQRGKPRRPRGLVLAPTRELAAQITTELAPLLRTRGMRVHPFYGGVGFGGQLRALRDGIDVAVACPGRLTDLANGGHIDLRNVDFVVIDEADRMADMGFLPVVRRLLDSTSTNRQTLLFSATLDGDVDVLVRQYQRDPIRHEVIATGSDLSRVIHQFHAIDAAARAEACAELVAGAGSTVVFVRTRHGADRLARQLTRSGIRSAAIHGDRSQGQRDKALASFKAGGVQALVATDVAARGIHVDDVGCVIHFDLPADSKDYVHRSGRTARAGASGMVIALVTPDRRADATAMIRTLGLEAELVGTWTSQAHGGRSGARQSAGVGAPRGRQPQPRRGGTSQRGAQATRHGGQQRRVRRGTSA